jgi:hypothetical protein
MLGTPLARELAARLGLHPSSREWHGNCPGCGYSDTFMLTERRDRVLGWCASCQDQDFMTRLSPDEDSRRPPQRRCRARLRKPVGPRRQVDITKTPDEDGATDDFDRMMETTNG